MGKKRTKRTKRHQNLYKMKGCSKPKSRKSRKYRKVQGGSALGYTGGKNNYSMYPTTDPSPQDTIPTNQGMGQRGGTCGLCGMTGGSCGACGMTGGSCGACMNTVPNSAYPMKGGGCGCGTSFFGDKKMGGGGNTLPGTAWSSNPSDWPGVNGSETGTHLAVNTYKNDPQTEMTMVGPNPPYTTGGRKGKGRGKKSRKQKGGLNSNMFFQDFVNLGRQLQFNLGSASNAINGFAAPVKPLPWQGQLPNSQDNIIRASAL